MVNAPQMLRQARLSRISSITALIQKLKAEDKKLNYDNILMSCVSTLGISKKTCSEYLDTALFNLGITKEDIK